MGAAGKAEDLALPLVTIEDVLAQARERGFLGPGPISAHIAHSQGFAVASGDPPPTRVVDLGSGGGVPGLVLALAWPDVTVTLMDASERRTAFLSEAVAQLGLGERVTVVRGRAEELGRDPLHRSRYDEVVARGFASPAVTAECAAPLLALGGRLVISEPPAGPSRWDQTRIGELGLDMGQAVEVSTAAGLAHFQVFRALAPCPARYPRRTGIPGKRPLW